MSNNPSPALAALLSFLFPGLGQLYAGDPRKAVLWALPMLGFILAALWLVFGGVGAITGLVDSPEKRLALLIVNVAFFLYHIAAMINAYDMAKQERASSFGRSGGAAPIILAGLPPRLIIVQHDQRERTIRYRCVPGRLENRPLPAPSRGNATANASSDASPAPS